MVKRTWVLNAKRTSHPNKFPFFSVSAILSDFQKSVKSVDLTPFLILTPNHQKKENFQVSNPFLAFSRCL